MMTEVETRRYQRAGTDAFEVFFTATFPRARALGTRLVGSAFGEDLAIDALARAYARWKAVSRMEFPEAWVMRVVTNSAIDEIRRKKAYLPAVNPPDQLANLALRDNLVEALRSLTRRQQEVVVLRYIVDLSEADVGHILGMSTGSVKTHLHRAVPRLRNFLSNEKEVMR
jgi:RNA polymerase sigma-70 factor (ECF subfamily)